MKLYMRMFAILAALLLLFGASAAADAEPQDLRAPFVTDAGLISITGVYPASEGEPRVKIALSVPQALLGNENQAETVQNAFLLMSLDGIYHPDRVSGTDLTDGLYHCNVYFLLPAGSDLAGFRLVYGDQLRVLETTSAESTQLLQPSGE